MQTQEKRSEHEYMADADTLLRRVMQLDRAETPAQLSAVLPRLMEAIGRYTRSDRAYLFRWDSIAPDVINGGDEWCADGVEPTAPAMLQMPLTDLPNWLAEFKKDRPVIIDDWEGEKDRWPQEYHACRGQNLRSVILLPVFSGGQLSGFLGLDNPGTGTSETSLRLLTSVGGHLRTLGEKLRLDTLLKQRTAAAHKEQRLLEALSADYAALYYVDLDTDTVEVIKPNPDIDSLFATTALSQCYSESIKNYYNRLVIPESAPDFLQKTAPENLREELAGGRRLVLRYRLRPSLSGHEHFELRARRLQGSGFRMAVGVYYNDDVITAEQQHRAEMEDTLAELRLSNEIISAISKIYWSIYRVDLTTDCYEQITADGEMHHLSSSHSGAQKTFNSVCDKYVAHEHLTEMKSFLDFSTLPQRLADTDSIAMQYRASTGNWMLARFISKKRDENGQVTHVLFLMRIINKQKQVELEYQQQLLAAAEEIRRTNLVKTDFLRSMSHDIRTPINGIRGMLTIANHFPDDMQKQQECRDKIMQASGYLLALLNNVLDMSKLESGEIMLDHKPFDLLELLDSSNTLVKNEAAENGLNYIISPRVLYHRHLLGSPVHLTRVLQNIASNAVKYNKPGGYVHVSCEEVSFDEHCAVFRFTCSDNGRGMSAEFQERAFEPFSQESEGARTTYSGSGLGLAIAREIVERMDGSIALESEPGKGSTFVTEIPFDIDHNYANEHAAPAEEPVSLQGVRALLVEDNELNMEIAAFILESAGMVVTKAWNGREAVDAFAASEPNTYDVILMDVMMPVMSGLDAARAIRAMDRPDAATVPIFAMTANAFAEDVHMSMQAGMDEHLTKPLEQDKILRIIQSYVRSRRESLSKQ